MPKWSVRCEQVIGNPFCGNSVSDRLTQLSGNPSLEDRSPKSFSFLINATLISALTYVVFSTGSAPP